VKRLSAIEIAEGALLADIAVILQLIWIYLPIPGLFVRFLIPVVFSIVVLRRGLATGLLAVAVSLFVAAVLTGPYLVSLAYFAMEGLGGLFWGVALSRRWAHLPTLALGTVGLSAGTATLTLFVVALFVPLSDLIKSYQRSYAFALSAADYVTTHLGLGEVWHRSVYPTVGAIGAALLAHWWMLLLVGSVVFAWPVVLVTYTLTNVLVRLLGYEVAAFPGGRVDRLVKRVAWRLLRVGIRRGIVGRRAGA
jgi:hypothetical protein